jgi:acylphosphatase
MARAHLTVRGRVQGVWYRGSMQEEARRRRLTGWVRNRPDGSVEAEAQGPHDEIEALAAWARRGPTGARVDDVAVTWQADEGGDGGDFVIRRSG